MWSPRPQVSEHPQHVDVAREVDLIAATLARTGAVSREHLYRLVGARRWGPGVFRAALRRAVEDGRARHLRAGMYGPTTASAGDEALRPARDLPASAGQVGRRNWGIAHVRLGAEPEAPSSLAILNAGDEDAHVQVHAIHGDRSPTGPYHLTVGSRRTMLLRLADLHEPEPMPRDGAFALVLDSDAPVVVETVALGEATVGGER